MSARFQIVPWLIILIPFLVLAYSYNSLANPVLIARSFLGDEVIVAPKSFFTVLRVPLIEVVCAGAIEIMRRRFAKPRSNVEADYYRFWTILLYTVAVKSLLQTIETIVSVDFSNNIYYITFVAVIVGIAAAGIGGRKLWSNRKDLGGNFNRLEIFALALLLAAYIGLAFVPIYYFD